MTSEPIVAAAAVTASGDRTPSDQMVLEQLLRDAVLNGPPYAGWPDLSLLAVSDSLATKYIMRSRRNYKL